MPVHRNCKLDQHGAALILALFMLIAILLLGAAAAQLALQGEKAARGERDRHIAFQAAEEALMDAENDIEGASGAPGRSAMFRLDSAQGFVDGCGEGAANPNLGLCLRSAQGQAPVWQTVDISNDAASTMKSVPYGKFTGAAMETGEGFLPFKRPRYIIELVVPDAVDGAAPVSGHLYRVTAIGFGSRPTSEVVLQSFYRKPESTGSEKAAGFGADELPIPAKRMSWREVANWRELRDAANK